MVGSAVWRWCNILALIPPMMPSVEPQVEGSMHGEGFSQHNSPATECETQGVTSPAFQSSDRLCTTFRSAQTVETLVNTSLNLGSMRALGSESTTRSSLSIGDARFAQRKIVLPSSNDHHLLEAEGEDITCLTSQETLQDCDKRKTEMERDVENSNCHASMSENLTGEDVNDRGNSNDRNVSVETEYRGDSVINPVPYMESCNNANISDLKKVSHRSVTLGQDAESPWFSHYGEDMYEHVTQGLIYIETSIPGPGLELDTFEQMPQGCNCVQDCCCVLNTLKSDPGVDKLPGGVSSQDDGNTNNMSQFLDTKCRFDQDCYSAECPEVPPIINCRRDHEARKSTSSQDVFAAGCGCRCLDRTPASYKKGLLLEPSPKWPIYECNDDCHCSSSSSALSSGCQNRVVQRGPRKDLVILSTKSLFSKDGNLNVWCDTANSEDSGPCDLLNSRLNNACVGQTSMLSDHKGEGRLCRHQAFNCRSDKNVSVSSVDTVHLSHSLKGNNVPESVSTRDKRLPDKGFGVFTKSFIPRGAFICEYAGELLGEEEATRRFARQERDGKSNYILVLREFYGEDGVCPNKASPDAINDSSTFSLSGDGLNWRARQDEAEQNENVTKFPNSRHLFEKKNRIINRAVKPSQVTIIDPTIIGNVGRYLNHSCDPNTHVVPVRVNSVIPVAAMFALRDVKAGEELVYDYGSLRDTSSHSWGSYNRSTKVAVKGVLSSDEDADVSSKNNVEDMVDSYLKCGNTCHASMEINDANSNQSDSRCLEVGGSNFGLDESMIPKRDHCWGQGGSLEKKQKLDVVPFSGTDSTDVQTKRSTFGPFEFEAPVSCFDDMSSKSPCLCGANNCRGYLPAEVNLF